MGQIIGWATFWAIFFTNSSGHPFRNPIKFIWKSFFVAAAADVGLHQNEEEEEDEEKQKRKIPIKGCPLNCLEEIDKILNTKLFSDNFSEWEEKKDQRPM
jgi:hypothetical protein